MKGAKPGPRECNLAEKYQTPGPITTVMLRNIPAKYTQDELIQEMLEASDCQDHTSSDIFNFVYLPWDAPSSGNIGYAFINFTSHGIAKDMMRILSNYRFRNYNTGKSGKVSPAHIQGLENNLLHLRDRAVLLGLHPWSPVVMWKGQKIEVSVILQMLRPTGSSSSPAWQRPEGSSGWVQPPGSSSSRADDMERLWVEDNGKRFPSTPLPGTSCLTESVSAQFAELLNNCVGIANSTAGTFHGTPPEPAAFIKRAPASSGAMRNRTFTFAPPSSGASGESWRSAPHSDKGSFLAAPRSGGYPRRAMAPLSGEPRRAEPLSCGVPSRSWAVQGEPQSAPGGALGVAGVGGHSRDVFGNGIPSAPPKPGLNVQVLSVLDFFEDEAGTMHRPTLPPVADLTSSTGSDFQSDAMNRLLRTEDSCQRDESTGQETDRFASLEITTEHVQGETARRVSRDMPSELQGNAKQEGCQDRRGGSMSAAPPLPTPPELTSKADNSKVVISSSPSQPLGLAKNADCKAGLAKPPGPLCATSPWAQVEISAQRADAPGAREITIQTAHDNAMQKFLSKFGS
mmetsp:Transcript_96152/g.214195  ORF Transcript_96152/g.214195 Transcript_96152/m.214195 type:complete len:569 (+) Transcript_96152:148-1854(+)